MILAWCDMICVGVWGVGWDVKCRKEQEERAE